MRRRRGFTLLELLVVIVLVAMMAAVAVPRLGGVLPGQRLQGAGRRLASDMQYLYAYAVTQREYVRMAIDLNQGEYWAETFEPAAPDEEEDEPQRTIAFNLRTDFTLRELPRTDDAEHVEKLRTALASTRTLPSNVEFVEAQIAGGPVERAGTVYVEFTPWGYGDDAVVVLGLGERRGLVELHGLVGEAALMEPGT